jgi:energy-coupling factor transporter ATP-binding protein EcfA2
MKIIELRAENVKRLQAVQIRPDGNVVTISGRNGQGKTSVLDAIAGALGGKEVHQPEMIRRGAGSAHVILDLGEYEVVRRWNAETEHMKGSTTLEVRSKDGAKFPSPQTMLSKLFNTMCLDPHGFLRLERQKQLFLVKQLVKLDTSELDSRRQAVVERRTEAGRQVADLARQLEQRPAAAGASLKRVDVGELLDEQKRRQEQKTANDKLRAAAQMAAQAVSVVRDSIPGLGREVERLERELAAAKARLKDAQQEEQRLVTAKVEAFDRVEQLVDPDVSEVYRQIKNAEATNEAVRQAEERVKLELDLQKRREEHHILDAEVSRIDGEKATAIAAAKFPVEGLGFGIDGLTWEGLPFEQASAAEQLRVSVAMAIALNPKLRVMLVRDGSLLDSQSLQLLAELAEKADVQVWIERVAEGGAVGVVIEDGLVLEQEASTDAA